MVREIPLYSKSIANQQKLYEFFSNFLAKWNLLNLQITQFLFIFHL